METPRKSKKKRNISSWDEDDDDTALTVSTDNLTPSFSREKHEKPFGQTKTQKTKASSQNIFEEVDEVSKSNAGSDYSQVKKSQNVVTDTVSETPSTASTSTDNAPSYIRAKHGKPFAQAKKQKSKAPSQSIFEEVVEASKSNAGSDHSHGTRSHVVNDTVSETSVTSAEPSFTGTRQKPFGITKVIKSTSFSKVLKEIPEPGSRESVSNDDTSLTLTSPQSEKRRKRFAAAQQKNIRKGVFKDVGSPVRDSMVMDEMSKTTADSETITSPPTEQRRTVFPKKQSRQRNPYEDMGSPRLQEDTVSTVQESTTQRDEADTLVGITSFDASNKSMQDDREMSVNVSRASGVANDTAIKSLNTSKKAHNSLGGNKSLQKTLSGSESLSFSSPPTFTGPANKPFHTKGNRKSSSLLKNLENVQTASSTATSEGENTSVALSTPPSVKRSRKFRTEKSVTRLGVFEEIDIIGGNQSNSEESVPGNVREVNSSKQVRDSMESSPSFREKGKRFGMPKVNKSSHGGNLFEGISTHELTEQVEFPEIRALGETGQLMMAEEATNVPSSPNENDSDVEPENELDVVSDSSSDVAGSLQAAQVLQNASQHNESYAHVNKQLSMVLNRTNETSYSSVMSSPPTFTDNGKPFAKHKRASQDAGRKQVKQDSMLKALDLSRKASRERAAVSDKRSNTVSDDDDDNQPDEMRQPSAKKRKEGEDASHHSAEEEQMRGSDKENESDSRKEDSEDGRESEDEMEVGTESEKESGDDSEGSSVHSREASQGNVSQRSHAGRSLNASKQVEMNSSQRSQSLSQETNSSGVSKGSLKSPYSQAYVKFANTLDGSTQTGISLNSSRQAESVANASVQVGISLNASQRRSVNSSKQQSLNTSMQKTLDINKRHSLNTSKQQSLDASRRLSQNTKSTSTSMSDLRRSSNASSRELRKSTAEKSSSVSRQDRSTVSQSPGKSFSKGTHSQISPPRKSASNTAVMSHEESSGEASSADDKGDDVQMRSERNKSGTESESSEHDEDVPESPRETAPGSPEDVPESPREVRPESPEDAPESPREIGPESPASTDPDSEEEIEENDESNHSDEDHADASVAGMASRTSFARTMTTTPEVLLEARHTDLGPELSKSRVSPFHHGITTSTFASLPIIPTGNILLPSMNDVDNDDEDDDISLAEIQSRQAAGTSVPDQRQSTLDRFLTTPKTRLPPTKKKPTTKAKSTKWSQTLLDKSENPCTVSRQMVCEMFTHFAKIPVSRNTYDTVYECMGKFEAKFCKEVVRFFPTKKNIDVADMKELMKSMGLFETEVEFADLVQRNLGFDEQEILLGEPKKAAKKKK